jgi:uncharacterized membrane-anchored protein
MSPQAEGPPVSAGAVDRLLQAGIAAGLLPAAARLPGQDARPWPVLLLTALGAWLAALPLLAVVGLLVGDWIRRGPGPYLLGLGLLAAALSVLRRRAVPFFVEQLAVPGLLVGGGTLAFGLLRDLPDRAGWLVLAGVALAVAWAAGRAWLRVLLGALAAWLVALAITQGEGPGSRSSQRSYWLAWHGCLALWLLALRAQAGAVAPRLAAALEPLAAGWLLATLAGLALSAGMSFLVGASLGSGFVGDVARDLGTHGRGALAFALPLGSALLAVAGALWLGRCWPALRRPAFGGMALVGVGLAALMPVLGAALAALAVCAASRRWRLAAAAALAAAWIVGSFYYQLQWSLAAKAGVLVGAGALLGGLAAWAGREAAAGQPAAAGPHGTPPPVRGARVGLALSAAAVLLVANVGIWQKEALIAGGQPVFVELAPVDPRSLMQGDYMQLNFRLPRDLADPGTGMLSGSRPRLVARRDARGVAVLQRPDDGSALAADELRIELTPKNGRWILVSDAWFFKEGEAERWARARYGEFRVAPDGRALLVGLRGAGLEPL